MASRWPAFTSRSSGCRMVSGWPPLETVFETPRSADHERDAASSSGCSAGHTVSATSRAPRAFGWIPSAWFSPSTPATLSSTKRHERDALFARDAAERLAEGGGIGRPGVGRRFHAAQQHGEVPLAGGVDDGGQVLPHFLGRQAAQPVVAAELDDQDADVAVEGPVQPPQAAGRRVAGHAGVDDLEAEALAIDALLEPGREGLLAAQAVAGRDAVAEDHEARPGGRRRRGGRIRSRGGRSRSRGRGRSAGAGAAPPTPSGGAPQAPASSAATATNTAPSRRAFDSPTPRTHFRMAYRTLPLVPEFPTIGPRVSSATARLTAAAGRP